jgi:hypothetical protein
MARCQDLLAGCLDLEAEVGVKQNTADKLAADLQAVRDTQGEAGRCKTALARRREEFRRWDREGELTLGRCRLRLAALFGPGFNPQWAAAGFSDRSTMVPEVFAQRMSLLDQLQLYFAAHPEHESGDMQATAAIVAATRQALLEARQAVTHAKVALRQAVVARDKALVQLRRRMRALIRELDIVMLPNDPRWKRFGLNMPAGATMPEPVKQVKAEVLNHGRVLLTWSAAPHATRYRVQLRELGQAEFTFVATVHDTQWLLETEGLGGFIEIRVIAANEMDEAAPSPSTSVAVL